MTSMIAQLRVSLGLETAAFERGSKRAKAEVEALGTKMDKVGFAAGRLTKALVAAGTAVVAAGALEIMSQLVSQGLEYASSLGETAQQLGVTTDELQEYRYAATQVGIEQETMDKGLQKLTRTIGMAATGGKAQSAVFRALKIDIRDANGDVRTAGDLLPLIADALAKIPDPARRAAFETQLFGKAGQQLDTLLAGGSAAVNELRKAAHDLGIVLSEDQIQNADRTADKLSELKKVLEARVAGVVADNATAIYDFADSMAKLAVETLNVLSALNRLGSVDLGSFFNKVRTQAMAAANPLGTLSGVVWKMLASLGAPSEQEAPWYGKKKPWWEGGDRKPGGDLDIDLSPSSGGRGSHGRSSGGPSQADIEKRFKDQWISLGQEALSSMQSVAKSADERAELELRSVEWTRKQKLDEIDADKSFSAEQKERLRQQADDTAEHERARVEFERQAAVEKELADLADARFQSESDALRGQIDMARTQEERRRLSLELLDLEYRHKDAVAQAIIDSTTASATDKQRAQIGQDALPRAYGFDKARTMQGTAGPLASYLDQLPRSAAEANEAMEKLATDGIGGIVDGLADAATGARSLGDVFKSVVNQIIADLIRIQLQKAIVGGLSKLLGGRGGGGGGMLSGIAAKSAALALPKKIPHLAGGGPALAGRLHLVGEEGPELFVPGSNGTVVPNGALGGGSQVQIVPSPYFNVVVDGRVMQAAPAIASAGGHIGVARMKQRGQWSLR